jgi:hypothetical protein
MHLAFESEKCLFGSVVSGADEHYPRFFFFNFYFEREFFDFGGIEQGEELDMLCAFDFNPSAEQVAQRFAEHLRLANTWHYGQIWEVAFEDRVRGIEGGLHTEGLVFLSGGGDVIEVAEEHWRKFENLRISEW